MGDFSDHLRASILLAFVTVAAVLYLGLNKGIPIDEIGKGVILAFGLVVILGVISDTDVHSSIPRRFMGYSLVALGLLGTFWAILKDPGMVTDLGWMVIAALGLDGLPPLLLGGVLLGGSSIALAIATGNFWDTVTTHRGFLHSPTFAIICGICAAGASVFVAGVPELIAGIIGIGASGAVFVHYAIIDR